MVHSTLSDARCPYEASQLTIIVAAIEANLLTCFDPTTLDPIDIYHPAYTPNPVAEQ